MPKLRCTRPFLTFISASYGILFFFNKLYWVDFSDEVTWLSKYCIETRSDIQENDLTSFLMRTITATSTDQMSLQSIQSFRKPSRDEQRCRDSLNQQLSQDTRNRTKALHYYCKYYASFTKCNSTFMTVSRRINKTTDPLRGRTRF